ncbi:phage integrase SAM-like domain-containing protein [Pontibacter pamirensis]|uniref:phage integrase SAM-like domain-containing protein n=1 Tax=Pontibacter pamirensis TaxID=2562824 RepID=UPI00138A36B9|nr:phage integrase SAM-like domain-containing protein [Pontibacter pamirensis]
MRKLDFGFISDYEFWLKSVRGCAQNTTMKYLGNFKKVIHICLKKGWIQRDPFLGFKMSKKEVVRGFLSMGNVNDSPAQYAPVAFLGILLSSKRRAATNNAFISQLNIFN